MQFCVKSKIYLEKLDEAEFAASSFYLITTGLQPEMIWPAAISNPSRSRTAVPGEHESALQWLQGQNNHILSLPNVPNISPIWSPSSVKNKGFHHFLLQQTQTRTWALENSDIMSPKDHRKQEKRSSEVKTQFWWAYLRSQWWPRWTDLSSCWFPPAEPGWFSWSVCPPCSGRQRISRVSSDTLKHSTNI